MVATNGNQKVETVEQYIASHPEADPKAMLDVLMQQNVRLREEYRLSSEVEIDDRLNFRPKTLAQLQRLARMYSESGLVPQHYSGNIANCAIGVQMALRCKVDILTFLQSSYIVHGKPGIESKLAIAMLNSSGQIRGRVRFTLEGEGKGRRCTAYAVDATTGDTLSQTVSMDMAEAEGWLKNQKWKSLTDLMLQYRSAMFLIRVFFPDVLMGMQSLEELNDIEPQAEVRPVKTLDALTDRLMGTGGETEPAQHPGLARGEIPNDDKQTTEQAADTDPLLLDDVAAGFRACTTLEEVGKFETEATGRAKAQSDNGAIAGMAEEARERVRSSRGQRANGGQRQQELAGAR